MIRGFFRGTTAYVGVVVSLPRAPERTARVDFAIDTGSELTVLNGAAADELGVDADALSGRSRDVAIGFGGRMEYARLGVNLAFIDTDDERPLRAHVRVPTGARPEEDLLPSILGMGILEFYRITLSVREGIVSLVLVP